MLQLILITLKLAEIGVVRDLSWWAVMSPTLAGIGLFLAACLFGWIAHKLETPEQRALRRLRERLGLE